MAPLFQCPFCYDKCVVRNRGKSTEVPWRAPVNLMNHLSYSHLDTGVGSASLASYHSHVLQALIKRLRDPDSSHIGVHPKLRLLVWIDVANVDFAADEVLLEMMRDASTRLILQNIPIGWCTVQELFIPHTSSTIHGAYQISCRNHASDLFPFYAPTRAESGDLAILGFILQLYEALGESYLPPMVLMTLDASQRLSTAEIFGPDRIVMPLAVSANAIYHSILQALGDGIGV